MESSGKKFFRRITHRFPRRMNLNYCVREALIESQTFQQTTYERYKKQFFCITPTANENRRQSLRHFHQPSHDISRRTSHRVSAALDNEWKLFIKNLLEHQLILWQHQQWVTLESAEGSKLPYVAELQVTTTPAVNTINLSNCAIEIHVSMPLIPISNSVADEITKWRLGNATRNFWARSSTQPAINQSPRSSKWKKNHFDCRQAHSAWAIWLCEEFFEAL